MHNNIITNRTLIQRKNTTEELFKNKGRKIYNFYFQLKSKYNEVDKTEMYNLPE